MKAITFQGIQNVEVRNVEDPKLVKQDDIIVKVTSTTICGSDLHLIRGRMPKMPKGCLNLFYPKQGNREFVEK